MILNISWKNVWRNKSRSIIIMTAIMLGILAGILLIAFMQGMTEQRIESALKTEISHIQIHREKYLDNDDFELFIQNTQPIEQMLQNDIRVKAYSKRIIIESMVNSAHSNAGAQIVGIDPEIEVNVTDIKDKIIEGTYFEGKIRKPAVIGAKLAEKLNVGIRKTIKIQMQDTSGVFVEDAFKVAGIYKTTNTAFDESHVFIRNSDFNKIACLSTNQAHEIAILLKDVETAGDVDKALENKFKGYDVETWQEGNIMLGYLSDAMGQYMIIFMLFILLALFFGIVNTMLMAILERKKELGMLMATGMSKFRVFFMIMYETILLSLVGAIIGIGLGVLLVIYFAKKGLDLSIWSKGLEAVGYDPVVYFTLDTSYVVIIVIMVIFTGVLASIFPALKALKLNPAEALRMDN